MQRLRALASRWLNIGWAVLAIHLARKGHIALGKAHLLVDDKATGPSRLPHPIRARLAAAVGWQEGIATLKT